MKHSFRLFHITLAIILILALGVLPHHHHHHGHICWNLEKQLCHEHPESNAGKQHSSPCNSNDCSLNILKSFIKAEHPHTDQLQPLCGLLPAVFSIEREEKELIWEKGGYPPHFLCPIPHESLLQRGPPAHDVA